jgi:hypothetical protein
LRGGRNTREDGALGGISDNNPGWCLKGWRMLSMTIEKPTSMGKPVQHGQSKQPSSQPGKVFLLGDSWSVFLSPVSQQQQLLSSDVATGSPHHRWLVGPKVTVSVKNETKPNIPIEDLWKKPLIHTFIIIFRQRRKGSGCLNEESSGGYMPEHLNTIDTWLQARF